MTNNQLRFHWMMIFFTTRSPADSITAKQSPGATLAPAKVKGIT